MTDEERARIWAKTRAESKRHLSCDFSKPPPEPPSREPPLVFEEIDAVTKWRDEANEQAARFEAERAARKAEERESRLVARQTQDMAAIDVRLAELEARMAEAERQIAELSRAVGDFSDAVNEGMLRQDKQLEKLSTLLTSLRALDDQHRAVVDMPSPLRPRSVN
jgi:uncharacterized coiled-coil protein SlyX